MEGKQQKEIVSRSKRAELQFPVGRVDRFLREGNYSRRLSSSAPVFLAAVLESVTSNLLELAGEEAHINGKKRIAPEHVIRVVKKKRGLRRLFKTFFETLESDAN
ncbi:histone H2A-Bbd type 1 [Acomys russatus]|uniref:histone H2A-Bbd type 1 n=1 Tax=Acomys russatus TaxID=60746 RepID=UPI0021E1DF1A|nr:histone H2A-Bbd type 1 [Acomys russatus]